MTPVFVGYSGALTVDVAGFPAPKGSKTPIRAKTGDGGTQIVGMRESSSGLAPWRDTVIEAAHTTMHQFLPELRGRRPLYGPQVPLAVEVTFFLRPPQSAVRLLERGIPCWPTSKPDEDKLRRGVLDALTLALVYPDDAQVVGGATWKRWSWGERPPGARIMIRPAPEPAVSVLKVFTWAASSKTSNEHLRVVGALRTLCGLARADTLAEPGGPARQAKTCTRCSLACDPTWTVST